MAEVYKRMQGSPGGGRKMEDALARMPEVQAEIDEVTFEIAVRAEELLFEHRFEGHSEIEVDKGRIDRYVTLSDDRGQKAAMSIEYGREDYEIEVDGELVGRKGMEGLYILHRAANLPKRKKARVRGLKL